MATGIEWTDETWNPVSGCNKISPGCKNCYAERIATRFSGMPAFPDGFAPTLHPERLDQPLRWKRPRMVFVNSMSDLFGEFVPDEYLAQIFAIMKSEERHTFQILTKRSDRLRNWTNRNPHLCVASNIWLGVSVEDKKYGVPRIADLRKAAAAVRFLSVEPLLEDVGELNLRKIDWMIVGGESGPGARPINSSWVRSLRDQSQKASVPFFFKQWGGVQKKRTGRELDGRTWDEFPGANAAVGR